MIGGQPVSVPQKGEVIVGRADAASGWNPDVDLTPFGGTPESGVSRKHVKLIWQGGWMIEDLDSVNGTYLRGHRLMPQQRTQIGSGEAFQLGKLQVTFVLE
jgi:pSer/pThr/pTyr-binding forkhead associated (FHA) protein